MMKNKKYRAKLAKLCAGIMAIVMMMSIPVITRASEGELARTADRLKTLGLVKDSGNLKEPVTRLEGVELLVKISASEEKAQNDRWSSGFWDVPAGWPETAVSYAVHQKWVTGVRATEFRPEGQLTANAWAAFLLRMLGYEDKKGESEDYDFLVSEAALFACHIGLTPKIYEGDLTRGDFYQMAANALTFAYVNNNEEKEEPKEITVLDKLIDEGVVPVSTANALGYLDPALSAREIADRCTSAVFCITTYESQKAIREDTPYSNASGFFIDADGLAVTNYHSIEDAVYATATLTTGEEYEIERVLFYDTEIDIAILKVSRISLEKKETSAFAYLDVVDTTDVRAGDTVYSLGNPLGGGLAIGSGVISAVDRKVDQYALPCLMNTASISKGSSGGALLNDRGHVIAITTGAFTFGNNMYLAIPLDVLGTLDLDEEGMTLAQMTRIEQKKSDNK